ncbi:flagellar biosynthesis protein FliQ [Neiella sp. HB171785]|uniref:Flagellar biosynthetic protein FliQ n=2 Tax=Neiella TaxID=1434025 RepID=A0A8J6UPZ7_9GAMM|nr:MULTISPECIES: flagellar biosynthesis protein FliQ [Neiella]MBD1389852.1 flagellar biosynthesis protein FliQ [Neiella litorisoli]GGA78151.1 flagellar export apparatus protein FliQ [Neiella marina]
MTPEVFVDIFREALKLIVFMVSVIVLPSLFIGLIVAVFQAATSINEQTLSFLPRLIVTLVALMMSAHWLTASIMDFTYRLADMIPQVIG